MAVPVFIKKHRNFGIGVLVIGGFIAFQVLWPKASPPVRAQQKEERVVAASVDDKRTLHGQVDELKGKVEQLVSNLTEMSRNMKGLQGELADSKQALSREQKTSERVASQHEKRLEEELAREKQAAARREQQLRDERTREKQAKQEGTAQRVAVSPPSVFELRTIGSSKDRPKNAPSPLMHHVDTAYLPAGCFAKVRLVTGVNATSQLGSSGGASWGHPILYVIREPFDCAHMLDEIGIQIRRRQTRVPLDGCLGFATGKADLAASRVQGEGTLLSCVMPDGEAYEVPMKGFLVGADGVQGIFGEVQTHESAKIGKAFIAGMIEEAAAFFSTARKGVTISVSGQTTPYGGMETTMRKIADYWLAQASALQPTLFVPSNTEAYLVILQGVPLEGMHMVNWLKTGIM